MEYFKTYNESDIVIDKNKKKITMKRSIGSAYGSIIIDNDLNHRNKIIWKIKIHKIGISVCIGIDSSNARYINSDFSQNKEGSVGYYSTGNAYNSANKIAQYGESYSDGDIIIITLDFDENTVTFSKESKTWFGGTKIKTYSPIKINKKSKRKYRLCVYLSFGSSVEILSYDVSNVNDQNDSNHIKHHIKVNVCLFCISFYFLMRFMVT